MIIRSTDIGAALKRRQRGFIMSPYAFASAPVASTTWNPSDKDADIALSNSNLTATVVNANGMVRGTTAHDAATANHYFEIKHKSSSTSNAVLFGLANSSASLAVYPGNDINGWAFYPFADQKYNNGGSSSYNANNCVVGVKYDGDAGTVSFVRAGVDIGVAYSSLSGTFYPAWGPGTSGAGTRAGVINTGGSAFVYGLPAGYTAWGGTWNSADKDADVTLSGGDLAATVTAALGMVRGTQGRSTGKYYFEVECQGADRSHLAGIAKSTASLSIYPGGDANGYAYYVTARQKYNNDSGSSYRSDEIYGARLTTGSLLITVDGYERGTMYGALTGNLFAAWGPGTSSGTFSCDVNFGQSAFAMTPAGGAAMWG